MDIGMLYLHVTSVLIFLIFLLSKTFLLLSNKKKILQKVRSRTKYLEIILGILILVTGLYLFGINGNINTYLVVKVILVFVAIPLGIIGLKRENKISATLSLLIFVYIFAIAETKSITLNKAPFAGDTYNLSEADGQAKIIIDANQNAALQQGKVIYKVLCVECHGEDGKGSLNEAANLADSHLALEDQIDIITHGKGLMKGYEPELSEKEIELVAAYIQTLKQ